MNETDFDTTKAMLTYGGSFVVRLAQAARAADAYNLIRLKEAFSDLWQQYSDMAAISNGSKPRQDYE